MKKHSKKIVSLMLALLMVFSLLPMSSISALAAGSNSPVAVQADDTVTAAPAPGHRYRKHQNAAAQGNINAHAAKTA